MKLLRGALRSGTAYFRRSAGLVLTLACSGIFLGIYYGAYAHFGYQSAPGGDLFNHALMVDDLRQHGFSVFFNGYPKLFHLIALGLMNVTGLPFLKVTLYMVPVVMLSCALAVSWLVGVVVRPQERAVASLATVLILLFVSPQPWQTLYDGGFPNVIAAGIWLPLFMGYLVRFSQTRKWGYAVSAVIGALLVVCTHHITTGYLAAILLACLVYFARRIGWKGVVGILVSSIVLYLSPLLEPFRVLISLSLLFTPSYPWVHVVGHLQDPGAIWGVRQYIDGIGPAIVYFGLVGLVILASRVRQPKLSFGSYLIMVWLLLLLIGSQIGSLGFPARLARDLAVPLSAAAAICISWCWQLGGGIRGRLGMRLILVAVLVVGSYPAAMARWNRIARTYEPTIQFSAADQAAVAMINGHPAFSLARPLPSLAGENIHLADLRPAPPGSAQAKANEEFLDLADYALIENGGAEGYNGDAFRPLLAAAGFKEVARFQDPLKTVVLFARQNWYD